MNGISSIKYQTICIGLKKRKGHPACRTCCDSPRQDDAIHFYAEVVFSGKLYTKKDDFFDFLEFDFDIFGLGSNSGAR